MQYVCELYDDANSRSISLRDYRDSHRLGVYYFLNDNSITPIASRYTSWPFRFEAKSQQFLGWGSPMARVKFTRIVARRGSFVLRVRVSVERVRVPLRVVGSHACVPDRWIGKLHHACSPGTIPVVWSSAVRVPVTRN